MPADDPSNDTVLDTIAFATVDDLLILCYLRASPSDAEWDVWLAREKHMTHRGLLVWTDGGAPNARQRARVAVETGQGLDARPPVALLTDSMVIRSVMTAFTWVLGAAHPIKAFPGESVDSALEWLGVQARPAPVRGALSRLSAALHGSRAKKVTR
jgi:hypothetical protein